MKREALEDAMARCDRRSPRTFRQAVESWEDEYFSVSQGCETADPALPSPENEAPVPSETGVNADSGFPDHHVSEQVDRDSLGFCHKMTKPRNPPTTPERKI
jgi:hypothetical protein